MYKTTLKDFAMKLQSLAKNRTTFVKIIAKNNFSATRYNCSGCPTSICSMNLAANVSLTGIFTVANCQSNIHTAQSLASRHSVTSLFGLVLRLGLKLDSVKSEDNFFIWSQRITQSKLQTECLAESKVNLN